MAQQQSHKPTRSANTDDKYQSTFMPIFLDAEARLKRLIVFAFFVGMGKRTLSFQVSQIINSVKQKLPQNLHDRNFYVNGLIKSANQLINQKEKESIKFINYAKKQDLSVKTPQDFLKLDVSAKGSPQIEWYNKELDKFINSVTDHTITTSEPGKKPISLWQKAELDVRYEHNQKMIQEQIDEGYEYAFLSSHADCSKRCEPWQGELVALKRHAKNPQKRVDKDYKYNKKSFLVDKIDGFNVYSLPDIMAVVTPYNYNNNIIGGFNCRHHTIPYVPGSGKRPPREFTHDEVKKQREIETKIRELERYIRSLKMKLNEYNVIDGKDAKKKRTILERKIKIAVADYKKYCNNHGYAWYEYRIKVNDNNIYLREKN